MISFNKLLLFLISWGIFNYLIAFYEYYVYHHRKELELSSKSFWLDIYRGNFDTILLKSWNEYLKVDSRYLTHHYVWIFELVNIVLAWMFIFILAILSLITQMPNFTSCGIWYALRLILILQAINCILYFVTLFLTWNDISSEKRQHTKFWHYLIYYAISAIWIIIPLTLAYYLSSISIL